MKKDAAPKGAKPDPAEPAAPVLQMNAATLTGDVRDLLLQRAKFDKNPLPWDARPEAEQIRIVTEITDFATHLVEQVVATVAAEGQKTIGLAIDKVNFEAKAIKVVASADKREPNRHALADAQGQKLFMVIGDADAFKGHRKPVKIAKDQSDLVAGVDPDTGEITGGAADPEPDS